MPERPPFFDPPAQPIVRKTTADHGGRAGGRAGNPSAKATSIAPLAATMAPAEILAKNRRSMGCQVRPLCVSVRRSIGDYRMNGRQCPIPGHRLTSHRPHVSQGLQEHRW